MSLTKITRDVHLQRYYPSVVAPAAEFRALADAENPEFKLLYEALWKWMANTFVYDLDVDGARRWESMLRITPLPDDDLETRRKRILTTINTQRPYTERRLQEMLDANYGSGNAVIDNSRFPEYELWVDVTDIMMMRLAQLRAMLRSIIPANLTINISKELSSGMALFGGGKVSMAATVNINASTAFTMDDFDSPQVMGGKVSVYEDFSIIGG